MARITVEDCIEKVQNRFDLIVLSAHRAEKYQQEMNLPCLEIMIRTQLFL